VRVSVASEADLWKLFWNSKFPTDGSRSPGELTLWFEDFSTVVRHILSTKKDEAAGKSVRRLTNKGLFYLLYAVSDDNEIVHQAVVPQASVLDAGRAMASSARLFLIRTASGKARIFVRYLGSEPAVQ